MWGAVIGGGLALAGGVLGGSAAKKAAAGQAQAAAAATAEERRQFDLSRADLAPFRDVGTGAINRLGIGLGLPGQIDPNDPRYRAIVERMQVERDAAQKAGTGFSVFDDWNTPRDVRQRFDESLKRDATAEFLKTHGDPAAGDPMSGALTRRFTMADFESDPVTRASLEFGLTEGQKALSRMRRAQGTFNSGGTAKALARYTTDYVGQQAGASRDRFVQDQTNVYNRYAGVAGTGQTAATNTAQLGANVAGRTGEYLTGAANARGAAGIASANAYGNAFANAGNTIQREFLLNEFRRPTATAPNYGQAFQVDDAYFSLA